MTMIKRILFPTDGSPFSEKALQYATNLSKSYGASLTALHVICVKPPKPLDIGSLSTDMGAKAEACCKPVEEKAKDEGIKVDTKVVVARSICSAICDEAKSGEYDLIVMGAKGTDGLPQIFLGNVSDKVVHKAPCPVLVVR